MSLDCENEITPLFLGVTEEQRKAIMELYSQNNWDLNEMSESTRSQCNHQNCHAQVQENSLNPEPLIKMDPSDEKCPHCLCRPCIISEQFRQSWWASQNERPRIQNSGLRKTAYRKFWTMMYHRGVWNCQEYMDRKVSAFGLDPQRTKYVYHKRDIMPDCVLKVVRTWYPNPTNRPYMGHYWE